MINVNAYLDEKNAYLKKKGGGVSLLFLSLDSH